ncbi:MAG: PHP domain-containing protein [Bacteroidota bacterium]
MKLYRADLHIHTVLSPCGSLEMSPGHIISRAKEKGLDILGITDHNSTRQCKVMKQVGAREGIHILCGVEINTREEVHCLAFFEHAGSLEAFEKLIDNHLPDVRNDPEKFGYQAVVDENEQILDQPEKLLINAIDLSIEAVENKVHEMGGIFIPAHIDRVRNGIIAQLGFIPGALHCDALEISPFTDHKSILAEYDYLEKYMFVQGSDAHYPEDIGKGYTLFSLENAEFAEIKMALGGINGRKTEIV